MPERLECEVLQKVRYINTLTFMSRVVNINVSVVVVVNSFSDLGADAQSVALSSAWRCIYFLQVALLSQRGRAMFRVCQ